MSERIRAGRNTSKGGRKNGWRNGGGVLFRMGPFPPSGKHPASSKGENHPAQRVIETSSRVAATSSRKGVLEYSRILCLHVDVDADGIHEPVAARGTGLETANDR